MILTAIVLNLFSRSTDEDHEPEFPEHQERETLQELKGRL